MYRDRYRRKVFEDEDEPLHIEDRIAYLESRIFSLENKIDSSQSKQSESDPIGKWNYHTTLNPNQMVRISGSHHTAYKYFEP